MKIVFANLILIASLSSLSFASENEGSNINPKCVQMFELCVELRKSLITDMTNHTKLESDFPFVMPEYTDYQCTEKLREMEQNGECD